MASRSKGIMKFWYRCDSARIDMTKALVMARMDCFIMYSSLPAASQRLGSVAMMASPNWDTCDSSRVTITLVVSRMASLVSSMLTSWRRLINKLKMSPA